MIQFRNIITAIIIAISIVILGEVLYYKYMPIKHFVHYKGVRLVGEAIAGQPLLFVSSLKVKAGVKLVWSDILKCKKPNTEQFVKISSQPFQKNYPEGRGWTDEDSVWQYSGVTGSPGDYCYIEYGPQVILPYFITRLYEQGITDVFKISG